MPLNEFFADLHIHIGRDQENNPVKISASHTLTLKNIIHEAGKRKGIDLIGIIDCHSPNVLTEIEQCVIQADAVQLQTGGIRFGRVTLLLGSEIELYDTTCQGPIHVLCFIPTLENMRYFSNWLKMKMTNISLSSQRFYGTAKELQQKVKELDGLFIPAHVFTPFKSLYGKGVNCSLEEVLDPTMIDAIELGLSADTDMADQIAELHSYTYVTNSDSHSLGKIAREYQKVTLREPSFVEFTAALYEKDGRKIAANYGMNPKLGKYYSTVCRACSNQVGAKDMICSHCNSKAIVRGVFDRIQQLKTATTKRTRPPYIYQVPLDYIPGLGPKTLEKLLDAFQTEMNIIHFATEKQLLQVVNEKIAKAILAMRTGKQHIQAGGGGTYGRVTFDHK
ncbi:MAG TPA: endonuclease Q family protein [Pseudogracilibacillus sp.]|nr:endonuclease Q family protein [Pseudogracilibacillus sp.]